MRQRLGKAVAGGSVIAFALLILAFRLGWSTPDDWTIYDHKSFKVTYVVDGDTLYVDQPDGPKDHTSVRFWGIDTPELWHRPGDPPDQPYANEARALATKLALHQRVTLVLESRRTRGKYGRLLAYVMLPDGRSLNEILVRKGLAHADRRFDHHLYNHYLALEDQAKADHLGLWSRK
jgi:micrococcal nuclease